MSESWNYVRFGDLFDYENKSKIKAGDGLTSGSFPFYTSSVEQTKFIDQFQFNRTSLIFGTGGNASIHFCDSLFSVSTDCLVTFPKDETQVYPRFVYFYISGNMYLLEDGFKGAGLKHISKGYINEIQIPLPPLETQKRIADILDAADALRQKDQELLKKYDELAQAIFIDIFGDPVKNEKGWDEVKLESVCLKITDGTHQSPKFKSMGIPFLLVSNIEKNRINYNTKKFISDEDYEILNKRTPIEIGNILLTTVGSYGNPAIILNESPFAFQRHIAFIKPNHKVINYTYLFGLLLSPLVKNQIDKLVNGVAQKTLNLSDLKKLKIWTPPLELQEKYSKKLNSIESGLIKLDSGISTVLFNSLLQKAFKGELI